MTTTTALQKYGTQLLFADHSGDFGATPTTPANSLILGTPTDVQIDTGGVTAAAMRQSTKTGSLAFDAGVNNSMPMEWVLGACIENATAPDAGGTWDFYWSGSPSATAGTGNSGKTTGADAAYTADGLSQMVFIGSLVVANTVVNMDAQIGTFSMPYLYGSLVVVNNTSTAMATVVDETHIVITPVISDVQAAV